MRRFITISRSNDALFGKYLKGHLENGQRAILCESVAAFNKEKATFEIFKKNEIIKPNFLKILYELLRIDTLPLILSPILVYLFLSHISGKAVVLSEIALIIISVTCFHVSVFLSNDYEDYKNGVDSLEESSGSKAIKKGWLSAQSVNIWSYGYLVVGGVSGLILLKDDPAFILTSILAVFLAYIGYSKGSKSLKSLGLGELTAFICLGPLLALAMFSRLNISSTTYFLFFSAIFGMFGVLYVGSRQLENIMADQKAGIKTLSVKLGFEKAKQVLLFHFMTLNLLVLAFCILNFDTIRFFVVLIVLTLFSIFYSKNIWRLKSPLSSALRGLYKKSILYELIVSSLLVALLLGI